MKQLDDKPLRREVVIGDTTYIVSIDKNNIVAKPKRMRSGVRMMPWLRWINHATSLD